VSQDPFNSNFNPATAPNFFGGVSDPFLLSAQASASYGLQYQPLANNQLSSNLGFNVPGMGGIGQIGAMLASQMMAANGYTFTSMFGGPNSSVMRNRYEMQQMQQASMAAMQRAGGSILQQRMTSMGINLARQSGANQADADAYGQQWGSMASSMINNPFAIAGMNVLGAATGVDVLGAVAPEAAMAQGLFRASLTTYTGGGSFGLSPEAVATMTGRLADTYYPGGKGDPTLLRGFNGRQIGNIAVALQQQGIAGAYRTNADQFTGSDREIYRSELERTGDRTQAIASVNAEGLKGKLKEATRIFQIAKEITGSDDVSQMMQAIQTLTGGGMGTMSASAIESQMSKIQEVARVARLSMDQMAFITQQGSQMAQSLGLSGTVGAAAAVDMVSRATITYAASNRALGGEASPFNLSQGDIVNQNAKQMQSAMGSLMAQRLGGVEGLFEQAERVQPGVAKQKLEDLRSRRAAGGKLSAKEEMALTMMERLERLHKGDYRREDYEAFSGAEGTSALAVAASVLTGVSEGESRRVITQDRVTANLGLLAHPELIDYIASDANSFERQRQLTNALSGSAELNGIKNLGKDRQRELAAALADMSVNSSTGGTTYRDKAAAIQKRFGLSGEDMLTVQLLSEGQLNYITGGSLAEIAALKARGEGRIPRAQYLEAIQQGMQSNQALRDVGGTDFADRLMQVISGSMNVADALGGVKDETLRRALQDPLERASKATFALNNAATTAEVDAAKKRRAAAEKRYDELSTQLNVKGIDAPTEEKRKALEAERDEQKAIAQAAATTIQKNAVSESEMQDLVRQKEQAEKDLFGLLRNERTTVGAPSGVTDVPAPKPVPEKPETVASASPKPLQVAGKMDVTLNGISGVALLEMSERNLPSANLPSVGGNAVG